MKNDKAEQIHIAGGGLAGAEDAGSKLLINQDRISQKNANIAGTFDYISAETDPPAVTTADLPGLTLITFWTVLSIAFAVALSHCDLKCRPGDVAGTNGRDLCPPHGGAR